MSLAFSDVRSPGADVVLARCADEAELAEVFAAMPSSPGRLVLPFRHSRTATALLQSAAFLGITAECVPGHAVLRAWREADRAARDTPIVARRTDAPVTGRAAVLALGPEAAALAAQIGRLTGRPMVTADDDRFVRTFADLRSARSLTIVPPNQWTSGDLVNLLDARRSAGCSVPIGFLYPFGESERELFALKTVLYSRFFTGGGRYRFLYPIEARAASFAVSDADVVIGSGQSAAATERMLKSPADFLFAAPHSNGVNMGLGTVVLCALQDRPDGTGSPRRSLPCFSGAACTRQRPSNLLVAPSSVRSTVVFLYTCWGVLLSDAIYDVSTSLAARFASSPYAAALLTTSGLSLLDRAGGIFMADRLRAGVPVGTAVADFNLRHFRRYCDTEDITVLFGDPELTIGAGAEAIGARLESHPEFAAFASATGFRPYRVGPRRQTREHHSEVTALPSSPDTYFALDYARCVVAGSQGLGIAELTAAADLLGTRVGELWPVLLATDARAAQKRVADIPVSMLNRRERRIIQLQAAWLGYFRVMVSTLGGFLRLQTDRYFRPVNTHAPRFGCPYCAGPARTIRLQMAGATGGTRFLVECIACATVLDALPPVTKGVLNGPDHVAAGDMLTLDPVIGLETRTRAAATNVAVLAVLEPFKKKGPDGLTESAILRHRVTDMTDTIPLPPLKLHIPSDLVPGVYHIDAIAVVGSAPAVLRRSIVVTAPENSTMKSVGSRRGDDV